MNGRGYGVMETKMPMAGFTKIKVVVPHVGVVQRFSLIFVWTRRVVAKN